MSHIYIWIDPARHSDSFGVQSIFIISKNEILHFKKVESTAQESADSTGPHANPELAFLVHHLSEMEMSIIEMSNFHKIETQICNRFSVQIIVTGKNYLAPTKCRKNANPNFNST